MTPTLEIDRAQLGVVAEGVVSQFNTMEISPLVAKVLKEEELSQEFKAAAAILEKRAYEEEYGEGAGEGHDMFSDQYRGQEQHGPIQYVCLYDGEKLVAFFSVFQAGTFLHEQSQRAAESNRLDTDLPILVFSKLVRDPDYGYKKANPKEATKPLRYLLISTIIALRGVYEKGFLIDEQAQPATQRLLKADNIAPIGGKCLLMEKLPEEKGSIPAIMLLYFSPLNNEPTEN